MNLLRVIFKNSVVKIIMQINKRNRFSRIQWKITKNNNQAIKLNKNLLLIAIKNIRNHRLLNITQTQMLGNINHLYCLHKLNNKHRKNRKIRNRMMTRIRMINRIFWRNWGQRCRMMITMIDIYISEVNWKLNIFNFYGSVIFLYFWKKVFYFISRKNF